MKIVVDANIIIAAIIRDGKCREILTNSNFEFLSPDFVLEEIWKYKDYILERSSISENDFLFLIGTIFNNITLVAHEDYANKIKEAERIMKNDIRDVPFAACYLALNCNGIWTNDSDYQGIKELELFSTKDLIDLIK